MLAAARERIARYEPAEGVIPASVHVPRSVLEWRVDAEPGSSNRHVAEGDRELILVCNEGYSSSLAAASLRDLGRRQVADLVGGFRAWRDAGLPTIAAPPPPEGLPGMGGPEW